MVSRATDPYRVSMVCLGNICRSPIAELVLREMVETEGLDVVVTSAGTGAWHVGGPMDPGSATVLAEHGLDPSRHVAQQMTADRIGEFDLLVAMDRSNRDDLLDLVGDRDRPQVVLLRDFDPDGDPDQSVPDPYGGGPDGFATVYAQVEAACAGLVVALPDLMRNR